MSNERTLIGRLYDTDDDLCTKAANEINANRRRIAELQAKLERVRKQNKELNHSLCEAVALKSQQSQESLSLFAALQDAKKYIAETLRLLQWDQLGWDVPEEVIEELIKAQDVLAAALEDDNE